MQRLTQLADECLLPSVKTISYTNWMDSLSFFASIIRSVCYASKCEERIPRKNCGTNLETAATLTRS